MSCLATLSLLLLSATARAEDPEALIKQGVELRRQGLNSRAEGYFLRAYQIAATARTAAQLGLAELAINKFLEADRYLTEALSSRDSWVDEHLATLTSSREQARKHLLRVKIIGSPKGTTYAIAGGESVALPSDQTLSLAPGAASLSFDAPERKGKSYDVKGAAGDARELSIDLAPVVAITEPPPAASEARPVQSAPAAEAEAEAGTAASTVISTPESPPSMARRLRIAGIVVGGVGVATAAVGAVLFVEGNAKVSDINSAARQGGSYNSSKDGNWSTLQNVGIVALVGGVVAMAGGITLFVVGTRQGSVDSGSVAFVPGPGVGVVTYGRAF